MANLGLGNHKWGLNQTQKNFFITRIYDGGSGRRPVVVQAQRNIWGKWGFAPTSFFEGSVIQF